MCNFDVDVFGSMYINVEFRYSVYVRGMMYICVISNCVNAVRYIYL